MRNLILPILRILFVILSVTEVTACAKSGSGGGNIISPPAPACGTPSTGPCPDPNACVEDADCNEELPACDLETHLCVPCVEDTHCPAELPACESTTHECVRCLRGFHCSNDGTLVCSQEEQICEFNPRTWDLEKILGTRKVIAKEVSLFHPQSVAVDSIGNLFIMDLHNVIHRIDSEGGIVRVGGVPHFVLNEREPNGDHHLATETVFQTRGHSIAVDTFGNVFVADSLNATIRKIAFAPNQGITAPGVQEKAGRVYTVAGDGRSLDSAEEGAAIDASFVKPLKAIFDRFGNLFVVDAGYKIHKIVYRANTGFVLNPTLEIPGHVYRVAGIREEGLFEEDVFALRTRFNGSRGELSAQGISAISFDSFHNMYVSNQHGNRVVKIPHAPNEGIVAGDIEERQHHGYMILGTGELGDPEEDQLARNSLIVLPGGLAVDPWDNLFVLSRGTSKIHKIVYSPNTGLVGAADEEVRGHVYTIVGADDEGRWGDGNPAIEAQLGRPEELTIDQHGNLYLSEFENNRVSKIVLDPGTGVVAARNEQQGFLYVLAGDGRTVKAGMGERALSSDSDTKTMAFDTHQNLYMWDFVSEQVTKLSHQPGTGILTEGVAEQSGHMYRVAGENRFELFVQDDPLHGDNGPAYLAGLRSIRSLNFDAFENLYLADGHNHRIRKIVHQRGTGVSFNEFEERGSIYTVAGTNLPPVDGEQVHALQARIDRLQSTAIDGFGNLYFSRVNENIDALYKLVQTPGTGIRSPLVPNEIQGRVIRIAGVGHNGFEGDGAPAINAKLHSPSSLAVDSLGNLFFADVQNHRIRKIVHQPGGAGSILQNEARGRMYSVVGNGDDRDELDPLQRIEKGRSTEVTLGYASDLIFDSFDNLYFIEDINRLSENYATRVRKLIHVPYAGISMQGVEEIKGHLITLFQSSTSGKTRGDGGPANKAIFDLWYSIALDAHDNLYIGQNRRIRKVVKSPNQGITLAGIREKEGFVYSISGAKEPLGFDEWIFTRIPSASAFVPFPLEGAEALLVSSWTEGRVLSVDRSSRKVEVVGGYIDGYSEGEYNSRGLLHPFAGVDAVPFRFSRLLKGVQDMVWDEISDSLYFTEQGASQVTQVKVHDARDVGSWTLNRFAGLDGNSGNQDGMGRLATFDKPHGLALDAQRGMLFVSDQGQNNLRVIELRTASVSTLVPMDAEQQRLAMGRPGKMSVDLKGFLWVIDEAEDALMHINPFTEELQFVFAGREPEDVQVPGTPFQDVHLQGMTNLTFADNGDLFLSTTTQVLWVHALNGKIDGDDPAELIVDLTQHEIAIDGRFIRHIRDLFLEENGRDKTLYLLEAGEGGIFKLVL